MSHSNPIDVRRPRGARPSPRHVLLRAVPHKAATPLPQVAWIPAQLSMWGNNQYGDCVTAEEAFAKGAQSPSVFIPDSTVIAWADSHGVLNGADLASVLDMMLTDGFQANGAKYDDGAKQGVDYSSETVLQSALSQGPVKIAIDADSLPPGAGNEQGWWEMGGATRTNYDHCVGLCGYGPIAWLFQQLKVPMPVNLDGSKIGYLLFTWSTIGVVDHDWIMSTCCEAWLRTPTTVKV